MMASDADYMAWLESEDEETAWRAAERLGERRSKRAVEDLLAALGRASSSVRGYAAEALGKIGDERAVEPLIGLLQDAEEWPRRAAAQALGRLGDRRAVEPLARTLAGDAEKSIRSAAAWALKPLADPRAVEPLVAALGDESAWVRSAAASALGALPDARAVEPLAGALDDCDESVRLYAAQALAANNDPRAVAVLVKLMTGSSFYIRGAACGSLADFGWEPSTGAERAASAVARCEWQEAAACGAAAAWPLLVVLNEASGQFEDEHMAFRADGARQALESVLESSAAGIDPQVLEELEWTEESINYPIVSRVEGNTTYYESEEISNTARIMELARAELKRRFPDGFRA